MHFFLSLTIVFITTQTLSNFSKESLKKQPEKNNCLKHYTQSNELFMNEFKWDNSLLDLENKFNEIYDSGKRIQMHANYDETENSFVLYHGSFDKPEKIKITENFINSIRMHIEMAIQEGFADFVFFPDMGHSHLYFPTQHWLEHYDGRYPVADHSKLYEAMFADPELKALYHLTEQLRMLDEQKNPINALLEFKYLNRNFMAQNNQTQKFEIHRNPDLTRFNTVHDIKGHFRWGQGFAISASNEGCFPYKDKLGQTRYFDIGILEPRYDPNNLSSGMTE